ncbi:pentapeptide repeat-containing protein [Streptomyces sp. NBC_00286]|uniref:pentapeptide repeat-containing protein n=1 Tax=Streptomyces sp. NBC_00286 TaxID=2975701 RepID=UPI002E290519|nr:pentapeptide repeat-containing protein [Streptomyces sp. NBC_00286]
MGEKSLEIRLGGIYALQRIMQDSTRDEPTVVNVLSAYVRTHATAPKRPPKNTFLRPTPAADIQAALNVLFSPSLSSGSVTTKHATTHADLTGAYLRGADLEGAADLRRADLGGADLGGADLGGADLGAARLGGVPT